MAILSTSNSHWAGIPGNLDIWITYNVNNKRVQNVQWDNSSGKSIRARFWNSDVLVYDETHGQGTGSENIPGNIRLVEYTDPNSGSTFLVVPENIQYSFETL